MNFKYKETEIGEISENWQVKDLNYVCSKIIDCLHAKKPNFLQESDKIFLEVFNVGTDGNLDLTDVRYISEEDFKIWTRRLMPRNNDIIITKTGRVGAVAMIPKKLSCCIGRNQVLLRVDNKKMLPELLLYYLLSPYFQKELKRLILSGTILESLQVKYIPKVKIPYPELEEQQKIVNFLSPIFKKKNMNLKINCILENIVKTLFKYWFVNFEFPNEERKPYKSNGGILIDSDLGLIPQDWKVVNLINVFSVIESGNRPKGGVEKYKEGIPSIGAENILGLGKFDYSKEKFVPIDYYNNMKKGIIKNGDVLLYKDGANIGRKSLFMYDFPFKRCCINEHVLILRTNNEITPIYLYLWLDQPWMTREIINLNTGSAQPGINQKNVGLLKILIPPYNIIEEFSNHLNPLINLIFNNSLENHVLSIIFKKMLPCIVFGKIKV